MRLEILNELAVHRSLTIKDFESLPYPLLDISAVLKNMTEEGYIRCGLALNEPYHITNRGREYRLMLLEQAKQIEEESAKNAKAEKQQRFDNKIAIASLFVSAVSFVLGLLAEHFAGLLSLVARLFH